MPRFQRGSNIFRGGGGQLFPGGEGGPIFSSRGGPNANFHRNLSKLGFSRQGVRLSPLWIRACSAFTCSSDPLIDLHIVREPVIGLIKWSRPKGLKVCPYVEKCAEFKNQTLKKIGWYTKVLCATEYPRGMQYLKIALKWGVPLQVYT